MLGASAPTGNPDLGAAKRARRPARRDDPVRVGRKGKGTARNGQGFSGDDAVTVHPPTSPPDPHPFGPPDPFWHPERALQRAIRVPEPNRRTNPHPHTGHGRENGCWASVSTIVRMRVPVATAVLVALVLLAAACGDGGGTAETAAPARDEAGAGRDGCAPPRSVDPGSEDRTLTFDGVHREYTLHVPASYDGEAPAPVVFNFHGLGSGPAQQDAFSNLPAEAGERGYVVVSPQGLVTSLPVAGGLETTYWNVAPSVDTSDLDPDVLSAAADDLGFVDALLDELEAELCLDPERVYAAGMSNGAAMSMALACTSDRFAAVSPVAGANFVTRCDTDTPPPVIGFHGTEDALAPYDGGDVFGFPLGLPGAVDQMEEVAVAAGCAADPQVEAIGDDVELRRWTGCPDGHDVEHYTVLGGGHTWPGVTTYLGTDLFDAAADRGDSALTGLAITRVLGNQTETIVATDLLLDFFDDQPG